VGDHKKHNNKGGTQVSTTFTPQVNINVIPRGRNEYRKKIGSGQRERFMRSHIVPMFRSGVVQHGYAIEIRDQVKLSWERIEPRFPQFNFAYGDDMSVLVNGKWQNRCSVYITSAY